MARAAWLLTCTWNLHVALYDLVLTLQCRFWSYPSSLPPTPIPSFGNAYPFPLCIENLYLSFDVTGAPKEEFALGLRGDFEVELLRSFETVMTEESLEDGLSLCYILTCTRTKGDQS